MDSSGQSSVLGGSSCVVVPLCRMDVGCDEDVGRGKIGRGPFDLEAEGVAIKEAEKVLQLEPAGEVVEDEVWLTSVAVKPWREGLVDVVGRSSVVSNLRRTSCLPEAGIAVEQEDSGRRSGRRVL